MRDLSCAMFVSIHLSTRTNVCLKRYNNIPVPKVRWLCFGILVLCISFSALVKAAQLPCKCSSGIFLLFTTNIPNPCSTNITQ